MRLPDARVMRMGIRSCVAVPPFHCSASHFMEGREIPMKRRSPPLDISQLVDFGIALANPVSMPEVLTCSCCASRRVVVRSFECEDCGIVTVVEPQRDGEGTVLREKRDRRREPRS